jgi:hypothetical protein
MAESCEIPGKNHPLGVDNNTPRVYHDSMTEQEVQAKMNANVAEGLRRAGRTSLEGSRGQMAQMMLDGGFSVAHVRASGANIAKVIFPELCSLTNRDNVVRFIREFDVR